MPVATRPAEFFAVLPEEIAAPLMFLASRWQKSSSRWKFGCPAGRGTVPLRVSEGFQKLKHLNEKGFHPFFRDGILQASLSRSFLFFGCILLLLFPVVAGIAFLAVGVTQEHKLAAFAYLVNGLFQVRVSLVASSHQMILADI